MEYTTHQLPKIFYLKCESQKCVYASAFVDQ